MKSRPIKSLWGIHKTRMVLQGKRIDGAIDRTRTGKKSIIPMRLFTRRLARFFDSWSDR